MHTRGREQYLELCTGRIQKIPAEYIVRLYDSIPRRSASCCYKRLSDELLDFSPRKGMFCIFFGYVLLNF